MQDVYPVPGSLGTQKVADPGKIASPPYDGVGSETE